MIWCWQTAELQKIRSKILNLMFGVGIKFGFNNNNWGVQVKTNCTKQIKACAGCHHSDPASSSLLGCALPTEYPSAWLSLAWRGLHTSLHPQQDSQGRLPMPREEPIWNLLWISGLVWSPGQSHAQVAGMATCVSTNPRTFDTSWSPWGPRSQADIDGASWHPPLPAHSFWRP